MIQLEQRHFEMFKAEAQRIIDFFGLHGWELTFTFISKDKNRYAGINGLLQGRCININLEPRWVFDDDDSEMDHRMRDSYTPETIDAAVKLSAFHEVMEILLTKLEKMTSWRTYDKDDVTEEIHNIIRIFENKVYPLIPTC